MIKRRGSNSLMMQAVVLASLTLAGCVISPRRLVDNQPISGDSPTPTPTPGTTPTPTPAPTPTPTPAAVASAMSTAAAAKSANEFLFVADRGSAMLAGFRISPEGALSPIAGSPFVLGEAPEHLFAVGDALLIVGDKGLVVYQVDAESGSARQTDSVTAKAAEVRVDQVTATVYAASQEGFRAYHLTQGVLHRSLTPAVIAAAVTAAFAAQPDQSSVVAGHGSFAYVLDRPRGQLQAFAISDAQKLTALTPATYPAGEGASAIALVDPH